MKIQEGELFNGRYRLISEKGRGAFGEVWLAHDEQIDLDVAVKIYIALDERGIEDFKSEYKTAYSLNHPNLLHAYHFDVIDKRPFLVMPFCPGSAEAIIGTTDEAIIWRFIKDVSSGLAYLHSKNILHRDIKPDNVLADAEGNFLITDFGVSTKMKSTLRRNSTRSMTDEDISGTIGYMAPELFTKNPETVKATDIWAFGATLFEMINGELPFYGQGGIMLEKGAEIPELKGSWSNDLRRTVEACLAKEPWDRPTAAQLAAYATKCVNGNFEKAPWKEPKKPTTGETAGDSGKTVRFAGGGTDESSTLTDQERIDICRTCQNRKHDMKTGLYCGLTGQKPDFKSRCNNLVIDQEELEKVRKKKEEVQKSVDQIGGWTAFFLWCGIGLGLLISTIRTSVTVFSPGVDAITIGSSLIYLALFLLIGIKAIIAFYKKQENAVPLATAYCIMIALDAAFLLVVNLITKDGGSWSTNIIWAGVWLAYLYHSEDIKDKFPVNTRKWHNLEKNVLTTVASLYAILLVFIAVSNSESQQTPVKTPQKPKPTVIIPAQSTQKAPVSTTSSNSKDYKEASSTNSRDLESTSYSNKSGQTPANENATSLKNLPSRKVVYSGVAKMDKDFSVKIKRIEIDFESLKGRSYYSDTPLNLEIVNISRKESGINLIIQETYPQMTRHSVLGDKISTIYEGIFNSDGSITGHGTNWKGQSFTFKFSPSEVSNDIGRL